jgi:hypothetical protein
MKHLENTLLWLVTGLVVAAGCSAAEPEKYTIRADVYADNWYAIYVGDELVAEDSVAYNTERSFNADSVTFDIELPAQLNFILKDFKEDDSGLEYIGTNRQQIGDGGFAAQFFDAGTDKLIAFSNAAWRCLPVHRAPLNRSCVRSLDPESSCEFEIIDEPDDWMNADFDDSAWPNAIEHSAQAVRPLGGYRSVDWHPDVKLIWSGDLETDNTILCRTTIPVTNPQ